MGFFMMHNELRQSCTDVVVIETGEHIEAPVGSFLDMGGRVRAKHKIYVEVPDWDGRQLFNDGLVRFGYSGHESGDEIMFRKYNILTISSKNIEAYTDYFEPHAIPQVDNLVTAWDIISDEHPGSCEIHEVEGKTVYDILDEFKDWGMYLAEQREED